MDVQPCRTEREKEKDNPCVLNSSGLRVHLFYSDKKIIIRAQHHTIPAGWFPVLGPLATGTDPGGTNPSQGHHQGSLGRDALSTR